MKKLLAVLFILLVPGLSSGGEEIDDKNVTVQAAPRDSALPDVFFFRAHTCDDFATNCGPDNLLGNPFVVYIDVFVPSTQSYDRHYIVTDIEGAFVGYQLVTGTLTFGRNVRSVGFSLTPGKLYRFIAAVVGADGRAAMSDPYTFKVAF